MSRWIRSEDERQGERDYQHGGRYGYDDQRYHGYDQDDKDYRQGFDTARRTDERRQEEREREEQEEVAHERRIAERCREEREQEELEQEINRNREWQLAQECQGQVIQE